MLGQGLWGMSHHGLDDPPPVCVTQVQPGAGLAAAVAVLRPVPPRTPALQTRPALPGVPRATAAGRRLSEEAAELPKVT